GAIKYPVLELDVIPDDKLRKVVDKFRPLVEKRGIVFVSFNNEVLRVPQACALAQIDWDSANEKAGLKSGGLKNPREKRGGCRLAVGARDHQIVPSTEERLFQGFGKGKIVKLAVEHGFDGGISAHHGIADDDYISRRRDILWVEALRNRNALVLQEGRHRGIDV